MASADLRTGAAYRPGPHAHPHARVASYRAPAWLPGGHAQTIWPFLLPRPKVALRRERVSTPDGDFWDFDWLDPPSVPTLPPGPDTEAPSVPTVVLFHGLEGSSASHYAGNLLAELVEAGWRGVIPHFRGCSGEPNRTARAYHSGDHEEVGAMLTAIRERLHGPAPGGVQPRGPEPDCGPLFAVGVSLGGSALLNWIGRAGASAARTLDAAAAVSAPLDLLQAGSAIDRGANRIYATHFLWTLRPKGLALAERHPGSVDPHRVRRAWSIYRFDDAVTAPLHGFAGTTDYWSRASSKPWLREVAIPTLVINARNDPFVPAASLPHPADVAPAVLLEQPEHGGHVGFLSGRFPGHLRWLPRRLLEFFVCGR